MSPVLKTVENLWSTKFEDVQVSDLIWEPDLSWKWILTQVGLNLTKQIEPRYNLNSEFDLNSNSIRVELKANRECTQIGLELKWNSKIKLEQCIFSSSQVHLELGSIQKFARVQLEVNSGMPSSESQSSCGSGPPKMKKEVAIENS